MMCFELDPITVNDKTNKKRLLIQLQTNGAKPFSFGERQGTPQTGRQPITGHILYQRKLEFLIQIIWFLNVGTPKSAREPLRCEVDVLTAASLCCLQTQFNGNIFTLYYRL